MDKTKLRLLSYYILDSLIKFNHVTALTNEL
jgi:hypothetical protein